MKMYYVLAKFVYALNELNEKLNLQWYVIDIIKCPI